ncbi:MAG: HAD family hydrolase [Nanoarchaeota archaeon]|nr:HAD family hydrolase [Nanoarchaeota archaeon]
MNKKLLTFDMDNTLIHSDKAHIIAFNLALQKLRYRKKKHWDIQKHFGKPKIDVVRAITPVNDSKIHKKMMDLESTYLHQKNTLKHVTRIKGVLTVLKKLKPYYKLAVLSNCSHSHISLLLKSANLPLNLFDLFIGGDEVIHGKPHPDEFYKTKKLLHQKPFYHIGDSPYDIRAAKKAGIKSIAVTTGFFTRAQLRHHHPTHIITSIKELPNLLLK